MSSYWKESELELLKNNYEKGNWEELLLMIPNKTETQLINKAKKFGLEREAETIAVYYDDVKKAWIEIYRISGIGTATWVFPALEGSTFEETKDKFMLKWIKRLLESKYVTGD
jgi:hypothetical protein